MGGVVDFVGDVVGGVADFVGDAVGEVGDFIGDVATEAKEIVLETPFVADALSVAFPVAAPYLQAAKAVNAAANGDYLTAALSGFGAYKGFSSIGTTDVSGMYEVYDPDFGWIPADEVPGGLENLSGTQAVKNIATGATFSVTDPAINLVDPTSMSIFDPTFDSMIEQGAKISGISTPDVAQAASQGGSWWENLATPSGLQAIGGLALGTAQGLMSRSMAEDIAAAQQAAAQRTYEAGMPFSVVAPGGQVAYDINTKTATLGLSPDLQELYSGLMGRAGEQAGAISAYDPATAAEQYYGQYIQPGLEKTQAQQRLALENRLLSQGMLGSTGGALRTEALYGAQAEAQRQARAASLTQAQANLDLMRSRQLGDISQATGLFDIPLQYANVGQQQAATLSSAGQQAAALQGQAGAYGAVASQAPWLGATQAAGQLLSNPQATQSLINTGKGLWNTVSGWF